MLLTTFPSLWASTKAVRSWKTQILGLYFCGAPSYRPSVYILSWVLLGLRGHMPPVSSQVITGALHLYLCVRRLVEFTMPHFICMSNAVGSFFLSFFFTKNLLMLLSVHVYNCWCMAAHQSDSPGSQSKGLWYIWVDHDCWTEQCRERSSPKIRQSSSFDGNHWLRRAIKIFCLEKEKRRRKKKRVSKKVIQETECEAAKAVVLLSLTCLVCVCSLKTPESNIWYGVLS